MRIDLFSVLKKLVIFEGSALSLTSKEYFIFIGFNNTPTVVFISR